MASHIYRLSEQEAKRLLTIPRVNCNLRVSTERQTLQARRKIADRTLVLGSYILSLTWSDPKLEREGDSLRWAIRATRNGPRGRH